MAAPIYAPIPRQVIAPAPAQLPFGFAQLPTGAIVGTGWRPDLPDLRDFTDENHQMTEMIEKVGMKKVKTVKKALPENVDLRYWCSPIENQLGLGSCTANAAVGIVEYYEKRAFDRHIDGSRLFVYKTTRSLLGWVGDTGAYLRTTMAALALFGVPPETFWTYTDKQEPGLNNDRYFDTEPTTFVYEMADNFECIKYFCHDPWQNTPAPEDILNSVKNYLAKGIPSMFGFWGFPSCENTDVKGAFAMPGPGEPCIWGHAVAAVGYDDNLKITNLTTNKSTTGALLIRNSWGKTWGDNGYGWLPYEFVRSQLAEDFWSILSMRWVDLEKFELKTHS